MTRLATRDLTLGYGGEPVVRDLTLEIPDGRVTVVVGPHTEVARAWAAIGSTTPVGVRT